MRLGAPISFPDCTGPVAARNRKNFIRPFLLRFIQSLTVPEPFRFFSYLYHVLFSSLRVTTEAAWEFVLHYQCEEGFVLVFLDDFLTLRVQRACCFFHEINPRLDVMPNKYLSFNDFLADASIQYERHKAAGDDFRYGQVYFNLLYDARPDISECIRGSKLDPFHHDLVKPETNAFVEGNW